MFEQHSFSLPVVDVHPALELTSETFPIGEPGVKNWREAFARLSDEEASSLLKNLFGVLPQRGCLQACVGCHAAALKRLSAASWEAINAAVHVLSDASRELNMPVQSLIADPSQRLLETFRDSDPAHFRFHSLDPAHPVRGAGDFAELVHSVLNTRIKIMTAGAWMAAARGEETSLEDNTVFQEDLARLTHASFHAGRISVSVSKQTLQYRKLGVERDAEVIAQTFMACTEGATKGVPVFLDMMRFSPQGNDVDSEDTRELFHKVITRIDATLVSTAEKQLMRDYIDGKSETIDGTANNRWMLPGREIGIRISPYLNIGRATKDSRNGKGQSVKETNVSDQLSLLPGNASDEILIVENGVPFRYTRGDLRQPEAMSELVRRVKAAGEGGFLAEQSHVLGNWFDFFRSEIDLTPPMAGLSVRSIQHAPGSNLPIGINLVMSDIEGGELQVVVPYKRILL